MVAGGGLRSTVETVVTVLVGRVRIVDVHGDEVRALEPASPLIGTTEYRGAIGASVRAAAWSRFSANGSDSETPNRRDIEWKMKVREWGCISKKTVELWRTGHYLL